MKYDDLYYKDVVEDPDAILVGQQFERRFPVPPGQSGPFPEGPGRNAQPPRGAPPRFNPTMPRGMDQQLDSNAQFGAERGGQPRNIRQCLNNFTFIWLVNGNSFWFYPVFVGRQQVEGFRWRQGRWEYDRIDLRRIMFFRCF